MKTFASLAAAAFALVAGAPAANAQALVAQPYQTLIVQPGTTVIRRDTAVRRAGRSTSRGYFNRPDGADDSSRSATARAPSRRGQSKDPRSGCSQRRSPALQHGDRTGCADGRCHAGRADVRRAGRCAGHRTRTVGPISMHCGMRRRVSRSGVRYPERVGPQRRERDRPAVTGVDRLSRPHLGAKLE